MSAIADNKPSMKVLNEITLDIDNDGRMDRAVLVEAPDSVGADLYIYLGSGNEKLDLSRKPAFLKKSLADGPDPCIRKQGQRIADRQIWLRRMQQRS